MMHRERTEPVATINHLQQVLHAQPFVPFAVRMGDGRTYIVRHPDSLAIPPGGRAREVVLYTEGPTPEEPQLHHIDLSLVLEFIAPPPVEAVPAQSPGGNGA
jgi:hypothetical protein